MAASLANRSLHFGSSLGGMAVSKGAPHPPGPHAYADARVCSPCVRRVFTVTCSCPRCRHLRAGTTRAGHTHAWPSGCAISVCSQLLSPFPSILRRPDSGRSKHIVACDQWLDLFSTRRFKLPHPPTPLPLLRCPPWPQAEDGLRAELMASVTVFHARECISVQIAPRPRRRRLPRRSRRACSRSSTSRGTPWSSTGQRR